MQRFKVLGFMALLATAQIAMAGECTELGIKERSEKYGSYGIREAGNYCVTADVAVNERSRQNHGWEPIYESSGAMGINASNVDMDLRQHTLTSQASKSNAPHGVSIFQHQNNILVKNGTLRVIGIQAVGVFNSNTSLLIKTPAENNKIRWCRLSYPECEEVWGCK